MIYELLVFINVLNIFVFNFSNFVFCHFYQFLLFLYFNTDLIKYLNINTYI